MSTKGKALGDYVFVPIDYFSEHKQNNADGWLVASAALESLKKNKKDKLRALNF